MDVEQSVEGKKVCLLHIFDTTSGVPGVILFRIAFSEPPQTTEELCTYVLNVMQLLNHNLCDTSIRPRYDGS